MQSKNLQNCAIPFFLTALALVSSCSLSPIRSSEDQDINHAHYHTYRWISQIDADQLDLKFPKFEYLSGLSQIKMDPQLEGPIKKMVIKELNQNGYQVSPGVSEPDFYVTFYTQAPDQDWISSWQGSAPSAGNTPVILYPGYSQGSAYSYQPGSVVIVFYDSKTKRPSWSGTISHAIDPTDDKKVEYPYLADSIHSLIRDFRKSA